MIEAFAAALVLNCQGMDSKNYVTLQKGRSVEITYTEQVPMGEMLPAFKPGRVIKLSISQVQNGRTLEISGRATNLVFAGSGTMSYRLVLNKVSSNQAQGILQFTTNSLHLGLQQSAPVKLGCSIQ